MKSKGTAIAAPEGALSFVAYHKLRASNFFKPEDTVMLFNTGLKYLDVLGITTTHVAPDAFVRGAAPQKPAARHIGGIIGPY
jgi:hypothetical protein